MSIHGAKGSGDMEVKELCDILEQLRIMHDSEGAKAQAKDFQKVLDILEGHEDESIVDFVKNTQLLLSKPVSSKKIPKLNEVNIKRYVDRLINSGTDRPAFEIVFQDLETDNSMKKQEIIEVALSYTGYQMNYKTRKNALDEIRARFTEIARQEARSSIIDKITPW